MPGPDTCELLCLDLPKAEAVRERRMSVERATELSEHAKALADPTRLMLAASLADADELCVCDLSWIAGRSETLVSHHVRALRAAGVAQSRREGKMVMYSLTPAGEALLGTLGAAA